MQTAIHNKVSDHLKKLETIPIYFEELAGNNGDHLIRLGALETFSRLGLNIVDDLHSAEAIAISGSGDFSYIDDDDTVRSTRQFRHLQSLPQLPVVLLPSSFTEKNAAVFSESCKSRTADTTLFARDPLSYENLRKHAPDHVNVLLDHDMAFGLLGSEWAEKWKLHAPAGTLLIVERFDKERATAPASVYKIPVGIRLLFPDFIKKLAKRFLLKTIHQRSSFVSECESLIGKNFPGISYSRLIASDISLPQNFSFDSFCRSVASAEAVVSTRLHVCILAAILGRPFIAVQFEGGSKISECFKYSLSGFPNARLHTRSRT